MFACPYAVLVSRVFLALAWHPSGLHSHRCLQPASDTWVTVHGMPCLTSWLWLILGSTSSSSCAQISLGHHPQMQQTRLSTLLSPTRDLCSSLFLEKNANLCPHPWSPLGPILHNNLILSIHREARGCLSALRSLFLASILGASPCYTAIASFDIIDGYVPGWLCNSRKVATRLLLQPIQLGPGNRTAAMRE